MSPSEAPKWASDWRLKLALASGRLYEELWMELSGAAASCYTLCGRQRNGVLMWADVTEVLMARGLVTRAAANLDRQCTIMHRNRWWRLVAAIGPRLLECQSLIMQVVTDTVLSTTESHFHLVCMRGCEWRS